MNSRPRAPQARILAKLDHGPTSLSSEVNSSLNIAREAFSLNFLMVVVTPLSPHSNTCGYSLIIHVSPVGQPESLSSPSTPPWLSRTSHIGSSEPAGDPLSEFLGSNPNHPGLKRSWFYHHLLCPVEAPTPVTEESPATM